MADAANFNTAVPIISPRHRSIIHSIGSMHAAFSFPSSHHLIVTTAKSVFTLGSHGVTEIFRSGSKGIVAAKRASNGSDLLAVADSQVVVLHDINRGMQKSYRLRGSDGQVRLLRYAGDSKILFFTTTLQNAVQSYALKQAKLLDPSHAHPSPPTIFCLSPTSHLLLSASVAPPVIHLTNLTLGTPPLLLRPQCSSSAVAAANFHPERANVFLLAFADGSAAAFDAVNLFRDGGRGDRRPGVAGSGNGGETASFKLLHAPGNIVVKKSRAEITPDVQGYDASTGTIGMGEKGVGITAVAFVPGCKATAVTVGADGKCCVIDFGKREARLMQSWHLQGPATSLALLPLVNSSRGAPIQLDGQARSRSQSIKETGVLVAIGRKDGKVLLYDLGGDFRGEQLLDSDGGPIIDLEWMSGNDQANVLQPKGEKSSSVSTSKRSKRKSLSSVLAGGRRVAEEVIVVTDTGPSHASYDGPSQSDPTGAPEHMHLPLSSALNHLDLFSPVKPLQEVEVSSQRSSQRTCKKSRASSSTVKRSKHPRNPQFAETLAGDLQMRRPPGFSSRTSSSKRSSSPSIPPRPSPRKDGLWAMQRAETTRLDKATMAEPKSIAPEISRRRKGLALFAPYMESDVLAVPQGRQDLNIKAPTSQTMVSGALIAEPAEDVWTDVASVPSQYSQNMPKKPQVSKRNYHNVSFQVSSFGPSEASQDTVVNWSAAATRQPAPSMHSKRPSSNSSPRMKTKKGHVSLANSTESEDFPVQWSSFKKKSKRFDIHIDPPIPDPLKHSPPSNPPPKISMSSPTAAVPPLLEASRNAIVPPSPPAKPSNLSNLKMQACPCVKGHDDIAKALHEDVKSFRRELTQQLQAQKTWFLESLVEQEEGRRTLEEENRLLRAELARERKTSG